MCLAAEITKAVAELGDALPPLDAEQTKRLTASIVEASELYGTLRDTSHSAPASYRVRKWKRIGTLGGKLGKLAREMQLDLAYAVDRAIEHPRAKTTASIEELCALLQEKHRPLATFYRSAGIVLPSETARSFVEDILKHLKCLMVLAESAEMVDVDDVDDTHPGPPKKQPDLFRYGFVFAVSLIFRKSYGIQPTGYRDGVWCQFLAKVLTCCEGQPRDNEHAYKLWRKVEPWAVTGRLR